MITAATRMIHFIGLPGELRGEPVAGEDLGQFLSLGVRIPLDAVAFECGLGMGELVLAAHGDVLPGRHRQAAGHQAGPVNTIACDDRPPPPTPRISEALVTRPSIAPKTVGRSQPPDTSRWRCSHPGTDRADVADWRVSCSIMATGCPCR
jgi:hypothetical protein